MRMIDTMDVFCESDSNAEKAAFEAAMIDRIQTQGYCMKDMLFELYQCQRDIRELQSMVKPKKGSK